MKVRYANKGAFVANRPAFMQAVEPMLANFFDLPYTPPEEPVARAIFDSLVSDLNHDRELTARNKAEKRNSIRA